MKKEECSKLSLSKIKKTSEYKNIPRKYGKSNLTKTELCTLIEKLTEKPPAPKRPLTPEALKVRGSAERRHKEKKTKIVTDLSKLKKGKMSPADVKKMMKKYHLPTQKNYLREKITVKMYLKSK